MVSDYSKRELENKETDGSKGTSPGETGKWSLSSSPHSDEKSSISYPTKVSVAFALIALMTVVILASVLAVVWQNQFQTYARENMRGIARSTAFDISKRYEKEQRWSTQVLLPAADAVKHIPGVGIQVLDGTNNVLYDGTYRTEIPRGVDGSPVVISPARSSMAQAPITTTSGEQIGTVRVWAYGSDTFLTQNDRQFRENSYMAITLASLVAVVIAVGVGLIFSRSLVTPVRSITEAAAQIRDGNWSARTGLEGTDEIAQLGQTFDAMASSIQDERESERRLTTDVAHELRTPLMAIQSTVEAIQDGVFEADQERLAVLASEAKRLSRLVDAILKLSRLESGATPFSPVPTNLVDMLAGIYTSHEALMADSGLEFVFENETGSDEFMLDVDRDMVRQAVVNLISNAARYSSAGGMVTLGLSCDKKEACISVQDTGMGISQEDIDRIFSRFWRADAGRNRAQGGLGVGLSVTKEIMNRHKGRITVESEEGVGTKFVLHFPREGYDEYGNLLGSRAAKEAANARRSRETGAAYKPDKGDSPVFLDDDDILIG